MLANVVLKRQIINRLKFLERNDNNPMSIVPASLGTPQGTCYKSFSLPIEIRNFANLDTTF